VNLPLRLAAAAAFTRGQAFAAGWLEGVQRHREAAGRSLIPGSRFDQPSVAFAASQAAVAYCIGLETGD